MGRTNQSTSDTRRRIVDEEDQQQQNDNVNQPLLPQTEQPSRSKAYTAKLKRWVSGTGTIPVIAGTLLTLGFLTLALWFIIKRGNVPWHHDNKPKPSDDDLNNHLVQAKHGAVVCDVEVCSRIGVDIMKNRNGSAVDAAIASGLCIGVINGFASGIGGGGFMVVRHENGSSKSIDFREAAPAAASRDMYIHDPKLAQYGGLSVAVPGEIAGFHAAWKMYGRVEWATLFEDTIRLCEEGYAVTDRMTKALEWARPLFESRGPDSEWGFLFKPNGSSKLVTLGDTIKRPALGETLKKIAKHGWKTFYHGEMAKSMANYVQSQGGILTVQDMASYDAVISETLKTWAFGTEILTCPPPCSGPALIEGLNIAEGLDMTDGHSPLVMHRVVETMKWLSAGRTELGDPFDTEYPNQARVNEIQTKKFAARVRQNISDHRTYGWKHYHPSYQFTEGPGTSHINTLDGAGMAVSMTSTVNLGWGARICDPVTGIIMNGEMDDFSIPGISNAYRLQPSIYNFVKPGKRPLSSCAPVITVQDDRPSLIIGGSGGSHIVTSVVLTVLKVYKWGYSALDAIHSPRVHHQLIPESVFVESGVEDHVVQGLKDRGHVVSPEIGGSVVQVIHKKKDGVIDAVADYWRKGGKGAGY